MKGAEKTHCTRRSMGEEMLGENTKIFIKKRRKFKNRLDLNRTTLTEMP